MCVIRDICVLINLFNCNGALYALMIVHVFELDVASCFILDRFDGL